MGEPRGQYLHLQQGDPQPPPENIRETILERENRQLRDQVKHLQSALKCAAKTLLPYAKR
jgi:hypothetical protein